MERIKMIQGSHDRADEVKEWLKSQGYDEENPIYESLEDEEILFFVSYGHVDFIRMNSSYMYEELVSHDLIEIVELPKKPEQLECPFKPFDKVLMRDGRDDRWFPQFFSGMNNDEEDLYCYNSIGNGAYAECIPYEGNEHLAFTRKNPVK